MSLLKQFIIDKSIEVGIDICRFTDCQPLINLEEYLNYRIENNISTSFEESDLMKRIDPKCTLESCRSIIVVAMSYNVDLQGKPEYRLKGRLSRSSWGIDYHKVLSERIESLIEEIKSQKDFQYKYFVDTGPLIDRELAKKSGIGYYGKNSSIINDDYGSFIFIGYILTDLDIEKDSPVSEKCGDCTLCLRACPTGALEDAYRLNPKKCISYLTQTKENIPSNYRDKMGIKIYGCDTCQNVCPKNKGIKKSLNDDFIPKENHGYISIEELLNISNKAFKRKYGHISGSWRGKKVLKRNAIIALGNMGDIKNLPLLIQQLKDPDPMIVEYSEWAIVNIYLTNLSKKREL